MEEEKHSENDSVNQEFLQFEFNLTARQNYFSLYLGTILTALFLIIVFISLIKRRTHSVVIQLAKPDTDAHVHEYIVMLKTSIRIGSGLTRGARVAIQLLGSFSNSERYTLSQQVMKQNILQRGHCDIFVLYTPMDIGDVRTIECTLFNFSEKKEARWLPCYMEVMKSRSRERWGVCVKDRLSCPQITTQSYCLIKGLREQQSLWKLILKHHMFTSPFFNPHRFGAYTSFTSIVFFFFSQSVMLMSTMCVFIMTHQFLGVLSSGQPIAHFFQVFIPPILICSIAITAVLQQVDIFLMSIRPSPSRQSIRVWRGLWRNDYPPDLMHCDITYDWDRQPAEFRTLAPQFSAEDSLSSLDTSSESSESSLLLSDESSEEEAVGGGGTGAGSTEQGETAEETAKASKAARDAALSMLRYCMKLCKRSYTGQSPGHDHPQAATCQLTLGTGDIVYTEERAVVGSTVTRLTSPLPGVFCQFCLWVKHLTIRGDDLYSYALSLSHQIRRAIQAIRVTKDPYMAVRVMVLCLHQWNSSLCTRMLKETMIKLDKEKMDPGGLQHLHSALLACKSNLWFSEVGYKEGPLAGKRKGDNSHIISNLYFSIMRHLVTSWRNIQKGLCGILRRPDREIFPPKERKKKIQFQSKVYKKSIIRIADLMEMMAQEKVSSDKPATQASAQHKGSTSTDGKNTNQSASKNTVSTSSDGKNTSQSASKNTVSTSSDGKNTNQSASKNTVSTSSDGKITNQSALESTVSTSSDGKNTNQSALESTVSTSSDGKNTNQSALESTVSTSSDGKNTNQSAPESTVSTSSDGKNTNQSASKNTVSTNSDGKSENQSALENTASTSYDEKIVDQSPSKTTRSTCFGEEALSRPVSQCLMFLQSAADPTCLSSLTTQRGESDRALENAGDTEHSPLTMHNTCRVLVTDDSASDCRHQYAYVHSRCPTGRQEAGDSVRTTRQDRQFCELADNSCGSALSPPSCDSESQVMSTVDSLGFSPPVFAVPLLKTDHRNPHDRYDVPSTPSSHASHCEPGRSFTESQKISKRLRKGKSGISEGCDGQNTCNSCHSEGNTCNSQGEDKLKQSTSASMFSELTIRRMSTHVMKVFKRKMRRFKEARPETVFKMLAAFESYANVVQLEVKAPFGTSSCFCCAKPLCQSYAVMYSQFKEFSYRVLHHLVAHYIATRHHANQEMATVTRQYKKISMAVAKYIVRRARMMEKLGFPQNEEAIKRLEKEQKPPDKKDKEASSTYSYGSLDSLDLSGNNPAQFAARKGVSMPRSGFRRRGARRRRHKGKHYVGFQFGKRKAHHGLIVDWSHVPYPFTPTLLPPVRIRWELCTVGISSTGEADSRRHECRKTDTNPLSKESDVDLVPERDEVDMTTSSDKLDMGQPTTETMTKDARTTSPDASEPQNVPGVEPAAETKPMESSMKNILLLDGEGSPGPFDKGLHKLVKRMLRHSMREVDWEAGWVLGLKESLASVVAFARLDVLKEVQDPMKIAIRNFTHALLVLLFEELLPKEEEENFVVTPDDIRQRRKRVSSKRSPGLFDLTENNHPGYDLDLLDFVVVKLCERWELGKVEFQHQPTLQFLTRCLTMASLDSDLMVRLDELVLAPHKGDIQGLFLDRMTHVHETQHSLAVVVNEVMAMTLVYVVPETLKAMQDVTGWLKNEEERVAYVCEKVSVMENQVRHKLSRRVLKVAAEDVQDQLIVFARRQEKITQRSEKMINKLRQLVKEDYYYTCLNKDELLPIKKELSEIRHMVSTIHRVHSFEQARKVKRYARNTSKLQDVKVREALSSLTDIRDTEKEYSRRQLAEVEWLMTGQTNKYFPAACMEFALLFMFLVTVVNLILVTILGASFSPTVIGEWFGQFLLVMVFMILVSEPIKCLWLLDYGWKQPE